MARNITVGIDIGTYQVKVVVVERSRENRGLPKVIGSGYAESKGLRHGYIINAGDVIRSITAAVRQAEKSSGQRIRQAFLSVGGIGLGSTTSTGSVVISRADSEITNLDIEKAIEEAEKNIPEAQIINRKVLHPIPIQYKIDGKVVYGRPHNMKGVRLEAKVLFITSLENHLNDLIEAVEDAGIEVADAMASPIAASFVTLSKTQKIAGCVLANIGAETVSIVVFENNIPVSLEIFPIGSTDITNDIALGLKVPLEEAEQIKLGGITSTPFPRKKLEEIIASRLSDIFDLIDAHLKKIGRNGLLPAGIIITGGGSGIGNIEDLAKSSLKLPSRTAELAFGNRDIQDSTWSVAYGLCIWGMSAEQDDSIAITNLARTATARISQFLKQFLP